MPVYNVHGAGALMSAGVMTLGDMFLPHNHHDYRRNGETAAQAPMNLHKGG
jgi:hypothetical protein